MAYPRFKQQTSLFLKVYPTPYPSLSVHSLPSHSNVKYCTKIQQWVTGLDSFSKENKSACCTLYIKKEWLMSKMSTHIQTSVGNVKRLWSSRPHFLKYKLKSTTSCWHQIACLGLKMVWEKVPASESSFSKTHNGNVSLWKSPSHMSQPRCFPSCQDQTCFNRNQPQAIESVESL